MRTRNWYILVLLVLMILAGSYFLFVKKETKFIQTELINAVPVNTPFFIKIDHPAKTFTKLNEEALWWNCLIKNVESAKRTNDAIGNIQKVYLKYPSLQKTMKSNPLIVSFNYEGKNDFNLLYLLSINEVNEKDAIKETLNAYNKSKNAIVSTRMYSKDEITDVIYESNTRKVTFSYAFVKGIFIASERSLLVEDAIRQLESESLNSNESFNKIYQTTGNQADMNLYINHRQSDKLFSFPFNRVLHSKIKSSTWLAEWSELDVSIKNDKLLINGFSLPTDEEKDYYSIFNKQEAGKTTLTEFIPAFAWYYLSAYIHNFDQFQKDYEVYLQRHNRFFQRENNINSIEQQSGINIKELFSNIFKNEILVASIKVDKMQPSAHKILIVSTKSGEQTQKELLKIQEAYLKAKNITPSEWVESFTMDEQSKFQIFRLPYTNLGEIVFGSLFSDIKTNWFTVYENNLVFGDTYQTLTRFLKANILKETLNYDYNYDQFSSNLTNKNSISYFLNLSKAVSLKDNFLTNDLSTTIDEKNDIRNIYGLALQLSPSNNMIYNNFCMTYSEELKEEPQTIWQSKMESASNFKPVIVKNHLDPLNNEIVMQDELHNFYLINNSGRINWKIALDGPILGTVHQIDYYRNGKLQYLFNTPNKMYCLDRNGNSVSNYPITLRSKATNGVNVFDYDNNRNYRFFVAGEDQKIYAFSKEGKIVQGWNLFKTENKVSHPIQHFRVEGKDYIVAKDHMRTYILNRRGETRVKHNNYFEHSPNNNLHLEEGNEINEARISTTDAAGTIHYIYFDGKHETLQLDEFGVDHYFDVSDIDNDGMPDYIFVNQNKLSVYKHTKEEIFHYKTKGTITYKPNVYRFSSTSKKIGFVSIADEKIYLLNSAGELHPGFPLEGASPFSVGFFTEENQNFNLLVSSSDGFLYNYFVE